MGKEIQVCIATIGVVVGLAAFLILAFLQYFGKINENTRNYRKISFVENFALLEVFASGAWLATLTYG